MGVGGCCKSQMDGLLVEHLDRAWEPGPLNLGVPTAWPEELAVLQMG